MKLDWMRPANLIVALALLLMVLLFMGRALAPPPGSTLGGHDVRGQFLPWATYVRDTLRQGRLPLWDPTVLGGYPLFANPQVGFFYPPAWPALVLSPRLGLPWYAAFHLWMAGAGMWLFMRRRGASHLGAALSALTYAFSGFAAARLQAGHIGMVATCAWVPCMLLALDWAVSRGHAWAAMVAGLPLALAVLAGNLNMVVYAALIWLAFGIHLACAGAPWRVVLRQMALSGAIGTLLTAAQTVPLAQLVMLSSRTSGTLAEFGSRWSLPPFHLVGLVIPTYFGVPEQTGWWSVDSFEELTYYVGLLPPLILATTLALPKRRIWWLVALMGFGLLMALGTYGVLYPLLYAVVPALRLGRAPARAAFLFVFAAAVLLGEVLTRWEAMPLQERRVRLSRVMRWLLPVGGLSGLLGLAATGAAFVTQHPSETGGRLWHQAGGWAWALAVFGAGGVLVWRYLASDLDQARRRWAFGLAIAAILVVDLWTFGRPLVTTEGMGPAQLWIDAKAIIGATTQRVVPWAVNLEAQNDAARVGLSSVLGYNPLQIGAYERLTMSVPDPRSSAFDVLSASYVIAQRPMEARFMEGEHGLALVGSTPSAWVYRRPKVLPLARMVYQAELILDPDAAITRLHEASFDPAQAAILAGAPPCELAKSPDGSGTATIVDSDPTRWSVQVSGDSPGLLVLAENVYPGWRVTVDGIPATPLTAYTTVRAVCVPSGAHTVEWIFRPSSLWIGVAATGFGLLLFAAAAVVAGRDFHRRETRRKLAHSHGQVLEIHNAADRERPPEANRTEPAAEEE